jgi:hypothetical protein
MKARTLHISENNIVYYMLNDEDIHEMFVTAAMVREVNEDCYIIKIRQADETQLSNTLVAYHKVSGKKMKETKIMQLCRHPNLAPSVKPTLLKRVNTVQEGESFRFTLITN